MFIILFSHHNHDEAGQGGDPSLLMASVLKPLLLIIIIILIISNIITTTSTKLIMIIMKFTCEPGQRESIERRGSLGRKERTLDLNVSDNLLGYLSGEISELQALYFGKFLGNLLDIAFGSGRV